MIEDRFPLDRESFFQESNKDLREQLLDYVREGQLENLIHQRRMELRKHLQQYRVNDLDEDQSNDEPNSQRTCKIFFVFQ